MTATMQPSGNSTSMPLRLCSRAPSHGEAPLGLAPHGRHRDAAACPVRYWPVSDALVLSSWPTVPDTTIVAAVLAGARADVDDVVGDPDGVLVVLDHDHRVAQVPQADEGVDQLAVVPLVQADGRLVEHVEHADQPAADLRGQPDALRLAAGQGGRRAVEAQVVQAHVEQELHPGPDLPQHPVGDQVVALGQLRGPPSAAVDVADGQVAQLEDVAAVHGHGQAAPASAGPRRTPGRAPRACSPRWSPGCGRTRPRCGGAAGRGPPPRSGCGSERVRP